MDTLEHYRWAVQDPETHAEVLRLMYEHLRPGRTPPHPPLILREDFAGTSAESVAWVALSKGRRAIAVDLDASTIEWASRRADRILADAAPAVEFIHGDALHIAPPRVPHADILCVLNFSILYLHREEHLDAYLRHALHCLAAKKDGGGILVLNTFGGPEATRVGTTTHQITPTPRLAREATPPPPPLFLYHWEVRAFDTATSRLDCRIHFETIPQTPGSPNTPHRDAFRYDWRLWSLDELIAACTRAGFTTVQAWRHTYDESKGAAGVFLGPVDPASVAALTSWTAYIVAGV